jgi:hypothetical protein
MIKRAKSEDDQQQNLESNGTKDNEPPPGTAFVCIDREPRECKTILEGRAGNSG